MRWRSLAVLIVLAAMLAAYFLWRRQPPKAALSSATPAQFKHVRHGDSSDSVELLLGPPTGNVRRGLIAQAFSASECTKMDAAEAAYFSRRSGETFVVYFDGAGKVICKEIRNMAVHFE